MASSLGRSRLPPPPPSYLSKRANGPPRFARFSDPFKPRLCGASPTGWGSVPCLSPCAVGLRLSVPEARRCLSWPIKARPAPQRRATGSGACPGVGGLGGRAPQPPEAPFKPERRRRSHPRPTFGAVRGRLPLSGRGFRPNGNRRRLGRVLAGFAFDTSRAPGPTSNLDAPIDGRKPRAAPHSWGRRPIGPARVDRSCNAPHPRPALSERGAGDIPLD